MYIGGVSQQAGAGWPIKPPVPATTAAPGPQAAAPSVLSQAVTNTSSSTLLMSESGQVAGGLKQLGALALQMYIVDLLLSGGRKDEQESNNLETVLNMLAANALLEGQDQCRPTTLYAHSSQQSTVSTAGAVGASTVAAAYGGASGDVVAGQLAAAPKLSTQA